MVKRKGPGRVVRFEPTKPKDVTQAEIEELSKYQAAEWVAQQALQRAILKLEQRIARGARVEDGPLTWDPKLRMVRTKREKMG
ncbi:MAG: hypothetical protein KGL39_20435 [Patescibacteria group bacterium]|nr:hypothetical protein [Patescibacteria group bacterium]